VSENPYAAPKSFVEDALQSQTPMARPAQVVTAIWLALIGYGLGLIVIFLSWDYYSKLQGVSVFIGSQLISLLLLFWIYYKIYVGRNWARITLLVFSVLGAVMTVNPTVLNLLSAAPTLAKIQTFVALGFNVAILWLLFFSPGRHWFRRS
jgi:hypothetical protein